jgi:hypothetical protein
LIIAALLIDLLTPFFVWKGLLPASTRWISRAAIAIVVAFAFARMMNHGRIPGSLLIVVALSAIGITVALFEGQGLVETAWGWWRMFEFPLVAVFVYLSPRWPQHFPRRLLTISLAVLGFEVILQLAQYATGQAPGDNLAGTFGWHGVGPLVMFNLFVLCLGLGEWLATRNWKPLVLAVILGILSGLLGEMKIFPISITAIAIIAVLIFMIQGRGVWKLIPIVAFLAAGVWAFTTGFNLLVPNARKTPLEEYAVNGRTLNDYLTRVERSQANPARFSIGRNFAVEYGWESITGDPITFLFGFGLGTRGESQSLDTAGVVLLRGDLGLTTGSSLLVLMQEMGLAGLVFMAGFILWVAFVLVRGIRRNPDSEASPLAYALLLFSLLWPLWLWYKSVWAFRVPMLLYWVSLGFVLREFYGYFRDVKRTTPSGSSNILTDRYIRHES